MGDAADQQVYQIAHSRIHNVRAQGYQQRSGQCQNVILPCSTFRRGGLWLESPDGDCPSLDGSLQGRRHNLTMSGITFNPHQWQCPWEGHRITIAVYTVKAVRTLAPADVDTLRRLQFALPS